MDRPILLNSFFVTPDKACLLGSLTMDISCTAEFERDEIEIANIFLLRPLICLVKEISLKIYTKKSATAVSEPDISLMPTGHPAKPETIVTVLAHNEERRIAACIASLPLHDPAVDIHILVNGSNDHTAAIARNLGHDRLTVHEWPQGGKSRSWNRFIFDTPGINANNFVFVDGDAEIIPGSLQALVRELKIEGVNAAAGMPCNGRRVEYYREQMRSCHGLFGDLYALKGQFIQRLRTSGIRLPDDLIGDDGLIRALAATDLQDDSNWSNARIKVTQDAGFYCEPTKLSTKSLYNQHKRLVNYSIRHFQNKIITNIMRTSGPNNLPEKLSDLYPKWIDTFHPRPNPTLYLFDRIALSKMRKEINK